MSSKTYLIILTTLAIYFSGCGLWSNFTTYFNLYYNASDLFEQAESVIKSQKKGIFSLEEAPPAGSVTPQLVKVIEKCSKILQFSSESSYVDDALLMIGKAFYYQQNYQKALRKFEELIATQPNSGLVLETRLWIGKTEMRLKNYDDALKTLVSVRDQSLNEGELDFYLEAYVEEIKYYLTRENYAAAIEAGRNLAANSGNDAVNAEVMYELGKLYAQTNDFPSAVKAFEAVKEYSPSYEIRFKAELELGRALRKLNELEKASEIFADLRSDPLNAEQYHTIDLEIGSTLLAQKRIIEAVNQFVVVDTTYGNASSVGMARFYLGEIFETEYQNLDSAVVYYRRALSSSAPAEFIIKAQNRTQVINKLINTRQQILDNSKKLSYALDPEEFVKDSIAYYADTLSAENRQQEENIKRLVREEERSFQQPQFKGIPPQRPTIGADSLKTLLAKIKYDLGNLFLTEFNMPDSAYHYYMEVLNEKPNSTYEALTLYALGNYYLTVDKKQQADSIFNYIYDNFKSESVVNAAASKINKPLINLKFDPAEDLYAEAERELLAQNYRASSRKFYNIFLRHPQSPLAPKALYASGWILEDKLKLLDSAAVVYDSVSTKYPQSVYASKISSKLIAYKQEIQRQKKALQDSLFRIEKAKQDSIDAKKKPPPTIKEEAENEFGVKSADEEVSRIKKKPVEGIKREEEEDRPAAADTLKIREK